MVATSAFTTPAGSPHPRNMSRLDFVGRLFLMLDWGAWLIIDSISSPKRGPSLCEARFHTYGRVECAEHSALLIGEKESLRIGFSSNFRSFLATATTAPTTARDPVCNMLRWCCDPHMSEIKPRVTFLATLLTPGPGAAGMTLCEDQGSAVIKIQCEGRDMSFRIHRDLQINGN